MYSRNSPSLKLNNTGKKNSLTIEPPRSAKSSQAGRYSTQSCYSNELDINIKLTVPKSTQDIAHAKYSPIGIDKKKEYTSNLYQLARGLDKDKQSYSKLYKSKEVQQQKKNSKTCNQ